MKMMRLTFVFILCTLIFQNVLYAFKGRISYIGIEQGLSNNSVRCIYKDHNGFMWFGTYDGLNRYDGYGFKVFRNRFNDSNSLPHNYIYTINEDRHNNLWVGTGQGIGIYNNLTSKFLPAYYYPYKTNRKEKVSFNILAIKTDDKGNVFIGSNGWGLLVQQEGTTVATQVACNIEGKITTGYNVEAIAIDKNGKVWLFIRNVGLCLYDYSSKQIKIINSTLKSVNVVEPDDDENLWLGTSAGLYKYSTQVNALTKTYREQNQQLSADNVACLSFDKQHNLWVGTEGGGVTILDTKTEKAEYLLPGEDKRSLNSESVFAIYKDAANRTWICTLKGGINKIDPQADQFNTISHEPLNRSSLIYNFASCFYEDANKNLWIGTDGGGISIWDREKNLFTHLTHNPANNKSLSNNSVTSITRDHLNNIWVSTYGGGINRYNAALSSFEHYKCIDEVSGEENVGAWLLYEDTDNNLWASTFGNGKLYYYNRQANRFQVFNRQFIDLISLTEDGKGTLWAGDSHSLIRIDKQNKNHTSYEIGKPVRAIYEDKTGHLWIGTEGGGLILFDRKQGKTVARYSDAQGLCNNSVLNILEDSKGNLWLSTFNGLSEFNPQNKSFKNYYQDDGLQSNQFLYNAAIRLKSGELAFGGIKGFNIFLPQNIHSTNNALPLLFTNIKINNTPVAGGSSYVTSIVGDKINSVKIPFNDAVLSFEFAALEYSTPGKISYAYYLEGWDKAWNYAGNLRTAIYTHLSEGNYVLRVKSTNSEGSWNVAEINLKITILPPWYRSLPAYLLYALLVVTTVYFFQKYKTRQDRLRYEVRLANLNAETEKMKLEQERAEREKQHAELEKTQAEYLKEKAEHETERVINEREKEINEKRLSFFTNISHEFRTPLTLIINPIKDLLKNRDRDLGGNSNDYDLNIVYRNARRMLTLVDQLLLFRKADIDADKIKITKLNFSSLSKEVYLAFLQQAKTLRIEYEFVCINENVEIYADREKIEIILYNLISNALKYTPAGGKVVLGVSEKGDCVEVTVTDTGYGIPKEIGNKLFDKFYQIQDKNIPAKPGFGIGLYLVKHFVEDHKGEISYVSEPMKGTTFLISLKKGKDHFNNQDIYEHNQELLAETLLMKELVEDNDLVSNKNFAENKKDLEPIIIENQTILVIDDDTEIRNYIAQIFDEKFTIYQAGGGEEGLRLARRYLPDAIITDVNMNAVTGLDLCKTIKATSSLSHIPVILITGSSSREMRLQGVEAGADDFITKPFEKELLVATVANILKNRTVLQKYFYNEVTHQENSVKISNEYKDFLDACIAIVERHLDDDQFSIKVLAAEIGMSHSNLYRRVKAVSGQSVSAFIRFIKLRKAAEILINSNNNISETASKVGFNDMKHFREQFTKLFGLRPSEYIKKYRKAFGKSFNLNETINKDQD